jgi:hypothetical protein
MGVTMSGATLEAVGALGPRCVQFNFECAGLPSMPDEDPDSVLVSIAQAAHETGQAGGH